MTVQWRHLVLGAICAIGFAPCANAQNQPGKGAPTGGSSLVLRLMAFDKNADGKLTREEITDERLIRLFDRADKNQDGVVTREELAALAKAMAAEFGQAGGRRGFGGPPGDGPGGFGGPPEGGRGGPPGGGRRGRGADGRNGGGQQGMRGRGGPGGMPQPGQILPAFLQERLNLTADQKDQVQQLQKEIDDRLAQILTGEQKQQLKEMQAGGGPGGRGGRGRGGRGGPPGGRGGPPDGGPGGPPDGGPGGPPER